MSGRHPSWLLLLLAVSLSSACSGETSLLVEVTSRDLVVPADIDRLRIQVRGDESGGMLDQTFELTEPLPATYRVWPQEGHDSEAVTITVTASKGETFVVRGIVADELVAGMHRTVRVELSGACAGVQCPAGVDCVDGRCLTPTLDGGLDAGRDGGVGMDAAVDAGEPECAVDGDCDDGVACSVDTCEGGSCVFSADDSRCTAPEVCHPGAGCGEVCEVDETCDDGQMCNGAETCFEGRCIDGEAVVCEDGLDCTVDACDEAAGGCIHTPDDTRCEDGDVCNGAEVCDPEGGCGPGAPLDCDDATECTEDSCGEAGCHHQTRDGDEDGYGDATCPPIGGATADDCDDSDPAIFPGSPEICNGEDDDCDGALDEGFTCSVGSTGPCTTSCGTEGSRTCSGACSWSICSPPPEICNGVDDDCNVEADEGHECVQGEVTSCTTSCGTEGTQRCDGDCALGACQPPAEICEDGIDQDCDGVDPLCATCPGETDEECDDGLPCNGVETCFRGLCVPGEPLSCDDGVRCTVDECVDASGGCVFSPDDRFCDDDNFCDGAEVCDPVTGCGPGAPPSCDDGDACTDDRCAGTSPGMCVSTTLDEDGDGHGSVACDPAGGVEADDCDDADPDVNPGAPELCNGTDDDCDGACDDGFACCRGENGSCTTSCGTTGRRVCSSVCAWGLCSPPAEECNGIDDDCNGACDDGFACCQGAVETCMTSCGTVGSRACDSGCGWGACEAPAEVCSGVDEDCDGAVDEGFTCRAGEVGPCTTSCGTTGSRTCDGECGWGACEAPPEACNAEDDDCDGAIDEALQCASGQMGTCTTSCGSTGTRVCGDSCTWGSCSPPAETCNGEDDDCDGAVDEDFTCAAGSTGGCSTSCGSAGSRTCSESCEWGSCAPPAETCSGADDDCDGTVDEGYTCAAGATGSCSTACGSTGSRTCSSSCMWGTCNPPTESCNGSDDDCDVAIDEGFECEQNTSGSCTTGCGSTGTRSCSASCTWGSCSPPAETCNGEDDDCDGACDNGWACCQGEVGSCTTSCGSDGSRTCSSSCGWGSCNPPVEACNGEDDDCDGACDNGFACCSGDTRSCTTSCGTSGTETCDGSCGWGSCEPPAEVCNGQDDDCDTSCDEDFTCCAGATRSCTTTCGSTGTETCAGDCSGWGSCAPGAETCDNGGDDDCDGAADCDDSDCAAFPSCASCGACAGATVVSRPGGRYPITLGSDSHAGSCGGSGGSEGYLSLSLTTTSDVFITTHGAGIDTVLYVRDCNCSGTERACADDSDSFTTSSLQLTDLPPGDYQIFVDTKAAMSATVDVDVYVTDPGSLADRCGHPMHLPPDSGGLTGSTCGYSHDYTPYSGAAGCFTSSGLHRDVVLYFVLDSTRTVTVSGGCDSAYDQTFFLRSVCTDDTSAGHEICNDDSECGGGPSCDSGRYNSAFTTTLPAGLYYLFVDGYGADTTSCGCGSFDISLSGI